MILPDGTKATIGGTFDIVLTFYKKMTDMESEVGMLKEAMGDGILWISYPKGSSKVETDLNRDIIRAALEKRGLKAVSMISIDDVGLQCGLRRSRLFSFFLQKWRN